MSPMRGKRQHKESKVNKVMAELALMPVAHSVKNVLGYDVLG
mgnify:CR=1 FL=1